MKNIENEIRKLAERYHEGQVRKDGTTPYVEHPKAVAEMMKGWGFAWGKDPAPLAVAWGHDLLEDTECSDAEIAAACGVCGNNVLKGIKLLSRDKTVFPVKADYIRNVAKNASFGILAVKIADRICNANDFAALGRAAKALEYFHDGDCLFASMKNNFNGNGNIQTEIRNRILLKIRNFGDLLAQAQNQLKERH